VKSFDVFRMSLHDLFGFFRKSQDLSQYFIGHLTVNYLDILLKDNGEFFRYIFGLVTLTILNFCRTTHSDLCRYFVICLSECTDGYKIHRCNPFH
jgi:hypothetical protein